MQNTFFLPKGNGVTRQEKTVSQTNKLALPIYHSGTRVDEPIKLVSVIWHR